MLIFVKVFWCSAILFYLEEVSADYANSTISTVKMISDDFRNFQQTGQRVSGRDGRKLISFNTKNNNIEVNLILRHKIFVFLVFDCIHLGSLTIVVQTKYMKTHFIRLLSS